MQIKIIQRAAFTLVEIMIVVAIIGLLAAIAIPNFVKARTTAQKNACINNLRQIDGAIQSWALEYKKGPNDVPTHGEIKDYLRNEVTCPAGGISFVDDYPLTKVDDNPAVTCNSPGGKEANGHTLNLVTPAGP